MALQYTAASKVCQECPGPPQRPLGPVRNIPVHLRALGACQECPCSPQGHAAVWPEPSVRRVQQQGEGWAAQGWGTKAAPEALLSLQPGPSCSGQGLRLSPLVLATVRAARDPCCHHPLGNVARDGFSLQLDDISWYLRCCVEEKCLNHFFGNEMVPDVIVLPPAFQLSGPVNLFQHLKRDPYAKADALQEFEVVRDRLKRLLIYGHERDLHALLMADDELLAPCGELDPMQLQRLLHGRLTQRLLIPSGLGSWPVHFTGSLASAQIPINVLLEQTLCL